MSKKNPYLTALGSKRLIMIALVTVIFFYYFFYDLK
jgi:hypothetical protein